MKMEELARRVKRAALELAAVGAERKNEALARIAGALKERQEEIIRANEADIARSEAEDLPAPLIVK